MSRRLTRGCSPQHESAASGPLGRHLEGALQQAEVLGCHHAMFAARSDLHLWWMLACDADVSTIACPSRVAN